ncbi:terpenoid synthase, partial [Aureobasidium melanogenum]
MDDLEFDNGHLRDDYDTAKARLDKLRATMADESSQHGADEMLRIHLEIWNAIKQKDSFNGGISAHIRYRKAMNDYCDGVLEHVRSSSRQEVPTPEEYLEARKLSSGCEPLYALVEYAYGLKLSDDQIYEPSTTRLKDASTKIALLHNDMISWNKEKTENVPHNYIKTLIKHKSLSEQDASATMLDMVAIEHQQLSNCLEGLNTEKPTGHHKIYIESIPRVPLANLYWSFESRRYIQPPCRTEELMNASAYRASDFQPNNVLIGIQDDSVLDDFAKMANENPALRKEISDRIIYVSQPMPLTKGLPSLSDFSEARFGTCTQSGLIMPNVYRAPEVILDMEWSYAVDIWSFAMTLWDLFQPKKLFSAKGGDGQYSESHHLAQMVAILGNPPLDFLAASKKSARYWDQDGKSHMRLYCAIQAFPNLFT